MNQDEAREKILERKLTLNISRVPQNTFERFKALASNEEFCSDYGMCLKWLVDQATMPKENDIIMDAMQKLIEDNVALTKRVDKLEQGNSIKLIKTLDGKVHEVKK